jgi:hypothetical protein
MAIETMKECGVAEDEMPWYSEPINMWRCMETFMEVAETDDQRATLLCNTFTSRLGDISRDVGASTCLEMAEELSGVKLREV